MRMIKTYAPGILLAALLALAGNALSGLIPGKLVSGSVFALLIGMALNPLLQRVKGITGAGVDFVAKGILRASIVLMGFSLSFEQVISVGGMSLVVMCFTLLVAFGGGWLLGRAFGMSWKLSSLISTGAAICGGSAIASVAPVIDADDSDIAYAMSTIFLFDIVMVILFPIVGRALGMTDMGFGLWAGTAIHDTASVVAAGYAYTDMAGNYAVIVKLTRTLAIIPTVFVFSAIEGRKRAQARQEAGGRARILRLFPLFIIFFLLAVAIKSLHMIPDAWSAQLSGFSKFCMVMALGAIGAKTNFHEMAKSGIKPMLHGILISAAVVLTAFGVQSMMGLL